MNIGTVIIFCLISFFVGCTLGSWKEGEAVAKMADDLSAMHYKEIHLIVNKILEARSKKGGE